MNIRIFASLIYIFIFFIFSLFLTTFFFNKLKKVVFLNKLTNFLPVNLSEFCFSFLLSSNNLFKDYYLILTKKIYYYSQDLLFITFFSKNSLKNILNRKNSLYFTLILFQIFE
jgi:hypothetical protein